MLMLTLALIAAQAAPASGTDTTITVTQGTRLQLDNQGGDIVVKAWDRNQVRIQASHSSRTHVAVRLAGAVLSLEAEADRGPSNMVDFELTVPAWMALDLGGMYADVSIEGSRAPITVETLQGDITVKGGAETVKLTSTEGKVTLSGAKGRIELHSVSNDIEASDIQGDVTAETVSGGITLRHVDAKMVDLQTISGELIYDGRIVDGGHYSLLTHSGEIYLTVAEAVNATIATAIGSGEVQASFPLAAAERSGRRRQTYRLGSGSATVELETFSGDIRLLRPAEMAERLDRMIRARVEQEQRKAAPRRKIPDRDDGRDREER
jgi:hypothetical protein